MSKPALYIHFPWCIRKCPYCDFNSHAAGPDLPDAAYIEQLLTDLDTDLRLTGGVSELTSIFMGGGTPSLMSPAAISTLLRGIEARIGELPAEITMEANPGTVDEARFVGFHEAGITRLSVGVQTFSDTHLQQLGRIHSADHAKRAFRMARSAGFESINIDLMHGLPSQTVSEALNDLNVAIDLQPDHLSWYQLTIEPNTAFFSRPPPLPDEDYLWEIYESGTTLLAEQGYQRYEVSAFARQDKRCLHNLNYWQFGNYLGIGAGAHGKINTPEGIVRTTKTRIPKDYLTNINRKTTLINSTDITLEFMMNSLRMVDGFSEDLFELHTGLDRNTLTRFKQAALSKRLITASDGYIRPTVTGLQYLNELLMLVD